MSSDAPSQLADRPGTDTAAQPVSPSAVLARDYGRYAAGIKAVDLPSPVAALADEYDRVIGVRDRFLWKWIYTVFPSFTLSTVPDEHRAPARIWKTSLTIFVTLLDDLAEQDGDLATFRVLSGLPAGLDPTSQDAERADPEIVAFGRHVWRTVDDGIDGAPRRAAFEQLLGYDLRQTINAMTYSRLLQEHPELENAAGVDHYAPHNMAMFPYADVDLMYSPGFDRRDLGGLREVIWELQKLARIGNCLTTWERELEEGDLTSLVALAARRRGLIDDEPSGLAGSAEDAELIRRIRSSGLEDKFLEQWWQRYHQLRRRDVPTVSVDLDAYIRGMETVLGHHLASRGLK